jgi:hypothetical protein
MRLRIVAESADFANNGRNEGAVDPQASERIDGIDLRAREPGDLLDLPQTKLE